MSDLIPINLVVEDELSEAVLREILRQSGRPYEVCACYGRQGNDYIKQKVNRWNNAAKGMPYLVLTDLDRCECAPAKCDHWLPRFKHANLIFRIAVREVESWVLAHREAFAAFLGVRQSLIPPNPDDLDYPKRELIGIASKSRRRELREAIVPPERSTAKKGPDYNGRLSEFLQQKWDVQEAVKNSPSLKKAFNAISSFKPVYGSTG
ncbi:MAG: hypothetical protein U9P14_13225 [Gemmatimonadota bacterium]|nr:hypothetical protein [Gemmatimonadota bacterium]